MKKNLYLKHLLTSEISMVLAMLVMSKIAIPFLWFVWLSIILHVIFYAVGLKLFIFKEEYFATLNAADGKFHANLGVEDLRKADVIYVDVKFDVSEGDNDE